MPTAILHRPKIQSMMKVCNFIPDRLSPGTRIATSVTNQGGQDEYTTGETNKY